MEFEAKINIDCLNINNKSKEVSKKMLISNLMLIVMLNLIGEISKYGFKRQLKPWSATRIKGCNLYISIYFNRVSTLN